ncbi:hypothetical protein [Spirillospora sp. CA-294931]|uniref:hypothetical protein n=1 Tax=Spirillospora sp. CA-294931 TaxID=3240042 RepID=UPI003D946E70
MERVEVLRPSRRPLVAVVPLALVVSGFFVVTLATGVFPVARVVLVVAALFVPVGLLLASLVWLPWRYVWLMARGRTEVGDEGVLNKTPAKTVQWNWEQVRSFGVRRTVFGRRVVMTAKRQRRSKSVVLAAPRDGLLVSRDEFDAAVAVLNERAGAHGLAVPERGRRRFGWLLALGLVGALVGGFAAVERPWLNYWWPGSSEVGDVPRACGVQGAGAGMVVTESKESSSGWPESECAWKGTGGSSAGLWIKSRRRSFGGDGVRSARELLRKWRGDEFKPLKGVGEEATEEVFVDSSKSTLVFVTARKANVVVQARYLTKGPGAEASAKAAALARNALAVV